MAAKKITYGAHAREAMLKGVNTLANAVKDGVGQSVKLVLWPGFTPALGVSSIVVATGVWLYLTWVRSAELDPEQPAVQELLGHASLSTTQVYTGVDREPYVPSPNGVWSVSPYTTSTSSGGMPSSCDTIWANVVS